MDVAVASVLMLELDLEFERKTEVVKLDIGDMKSCFCPNKQVLSIV
jgi:hypothetical protein